MSGTRVGGTPRSPYPGPRPFTAPDREVFFGRAAEVNEVRSLWRGNRVLVLHGPAAVGKTSLLQAGVLPLMQEEGIDLLRVGRVVHQTARPLALEPDHNAYSHSLITSWAPEDQPPPIGTSLGRFLADRPVRTNAFGEPGSVLAAIDHFEELFTAFPARAAERERLIDELAEALHEVDRLKLLIVIRDDHVGDLADQEYRLSPYRMAWFRLAPLRPEAAEEAVTEPARVVGGSLPEEVAEQLVTDLRTVRYVDRVGGSVEFLQDLVEPLSLQITCEQLWSRRRAEAEVEVEVEVGVDQALATFYGDAVHRVAADHQVSESRLRQWFESAFVTEMDTRATAYRGLTMTAGLPNEVADALVEAQVLTTAERSLATWYELSQGRLISAIQRSNRAWREAHAEEADVPGRAEERPADLRAAAEDAWGRGNYATAHRWVEIAADRYRKQGDEWGYAEALVLQGAIARTEGDLPQTVDCYRRALSEFAVVADLPRMTRVYGEITDLLLDMGDYRAAADFSRQALERVPGDAVSLINLGYAQWYRGDRADALTTFARALATRREPRALGARGQILAELEQDDSALSELSEALDLGLEPAEEADTRSARAVVLTRMGRRPEADADLAAARAFDAARGLTRLREARVSHLRGDSGAAREHAQQALETRPPLPPMHSSEALTLLGQLDTGRAAGPE